MYSKEGKTMEEKADSKIKDILEWAYCIIIAVVLALLFRYYIGTPTIVKQPSMYNTLEEGQRLILSRWTRTVKGTYKRGDIITFEAPSQTQMSTFDVDMNNPVAIYDYKPKGIFAKFSYYVLEFNKTSYIKRVIGVAGDHIKIESGKVYLNGQELNEPYLRDGIKTEQKVFTDIIVPENCVFVMGDNRPQSMDSRSFGCIPLEKVESKVVIRFWPLNKFGKVK
ncbi:MAG TPA: signal peptidase I [Clostridiaceae bacterium]|mgnify:FL=1|nr:signal peptidase I [Clostridium sp. CAG:452]HJJ03233.1 signal peptidase I [Clostridiaceae bacterium]